MTGLGCGRRRIVGQPPLKQFVRQQSISFQPSGDPNVHKIIPPRQIIKTELKQCQFIFCDRAFPNNNSKQKSPTNLLKQIIFFKKLQKSACLLVKKPATLLSFLGKRLAPSQQFADLSSGAGIRKRFCDYCIAIQYSVLNCLIGASFDLLDHQPVPSSHMKCA